MKVTIYFSDGTKKFIDNVNMIEEMITAINFKFWIDKNTISNLCLNRETISCFKVY